MTKLFSNRLCNLFKITQLIKRRAVSDPVAALNSEVAWLRSKKQLLEFILASRTTEKEA